MILRKEPYVHRTYDPSIPKIDCSSHEHTDPSGNAKKTLGFFTGNDG